MKISMLLAVTDDNNMLSGRELAMMPVSVVRPEARHFSISLCIENTYDTFYYTNKDITLNFIQFSAYYNYSTPITVA
jgi:hypothetical protein